MDIQTHQAVLVLADIGGYTRFIKHHDVALVHAEKIITDLLESVIDQAEHPLTLNKLEGDAALFYALADTDAKGVVRSAFQQVSAFFPAFAAKRAELAGAALCTCSACRSVQALRIKAIVHFGPIVLKRVRQFEELAGEPVIVAHRLLKNSVERDEYVLVTEAVEKVAGSAFGTDGTRATEQCEGIGAVGTVSYAPPGTTTVPEVQQVGQVTKVLQLARLVVYQWSKRFGLIRSQAFPKLAGL